MQYLHGMAESELLNGRVTSSPFTPVDHFFYSNGGSLSLAVDPEVFNIC